MKARFIEPIGATLRVGLTCKGACPNERWEGSGHYAVTKIECALDDPRIEAWMDLDAIPSDVLPVACAGCGAPLTDTTYRSFSAPSRYPTASGRPEPGALYWSRGGRAKDKAKWEDVPHLIGVCPNGEAWDIDGPSSNGNGWTRTGEPPNITVSPSIWIQIEGPRGYHGFLQNGEWTPDLEGRTYDAPTASNH